MLPEKSSHGHQARRWFDASLLAGEGQASPRKVRFPELRLCADGSVVIGTRVFFARDLIAEAGVVDQSSPDSQVD